MDRDALLVGLRARQPAALARAISVVENGREGFEPLLSALHPQLGRAHRIGITGPPGAGTVAAITRADSSAKPGMSQVMSVSGFLLRIATPL